MDTDVQWTIRSYVTVNLTGNGTVGFDVYLSALAVNDVSFERVSAKQRPGGMEYKGSLLLTGKDYQVEFSVVEACIAADAQTCCVSRDVSHEGQAVIIEEFLIVGDDFQPGEIMLPKRPPDGPEVAQVGDMSPSDSGKSSDYFTVESHPDNHQEVASVDHAEVALCDASIEKGLGQLTGMTWNSEFLCKEVFGSYRTGQDRDVRASKGRGRLAHGTITAPNDYAVGGVSNGSGISGRIIGGLGTVFDHLFTVHLQCREELHQCRTLQTTSALGIDYYVNRAFGFSVGHGTSLKSKITRL